MRRRVEETQVRAVEDDGQPIGPDTEAAEAFGQRFVDRHDLVGEPDR